MRMDIITGKNYWNFSLDAVIHQNQNWRKVHFIFLCKFVGVIIFLSQYLWATYSVWCLIYGNNLFSCSHHQNCKITVGYHYRTNASQNLPVPAKSQLWTVIHVAFFTITIMLFLYQAPVVQKVDNAIHRINHHPVDSVVCFVNTYLLDSDLSSG